MHAARVLSHVLHEIAMRLTCVYRAPIVSLSDVKSRRSRIGFLPLTRKCKSQ
jgi:hypothetical protein